MTIPINPRPTRSFKLDVERNISVKNHSSFRFPCVSRGVRYNSTAVRWYKVDSRNGNTTKIPIIKKRGNDNRNVYSEKNMRDLTLIIKSMNVEDADVYECRDRTKPRDVKVTLNVEVKGELFIASIYL